MAATVPLCAPLTLLLLLLLLPLSPLLLSGGVLALLWFPPAAVLAAEAEAMPADEEQCSEVYFFLGTRALKVAVLRLAEGFGLLLELAALLLLSDDRQLLGRSSAAAAAVVAVTTTVDFPESTSRERLSSRSGVAVVRGVSSREDSE